MPGIQSVSRHICCFAVLALMGCSGLHGSAKTDPDAKVQIQICLPAKRVYFNDLELDRLVNHPLFTKYSPQQLELAPKVIRRIAASSDPRAVQVYGIAFGAVQMQDGLLSDGSGFIHILDSTVANQPVYESDVGHPAQNYVAIHVHLPDQEQGPEGSVTYWFKLPKTIPEDKFTVWFNPVSMEPEHAAVSRDQSWWKLTHGGDLVIHPVSADAPKMRVTVQRPWSGHTDPTTDILPALTTARLKYKTAANGQQSVYQFVPKSNEAIPSCD